jgi:D-glycero-D-manno-heptose 1,7-bisphosphate phosphatase
MAKRGKTPVFVDRDGTICFDKHYLADPNSLELIPTVAEGIRKLNKAGLAVIVVTNQSGIARGYFSEKTLAEIHERLNEMLELQRAKIDDIFFCPHMPNAGCPCRKPAIGMLLQAKEKHGFDLKKSFVIGDRMMDIELAHAVGGKGVLVPEPGDQYHVDDEIAKSKHKPDHRAATFVEAVDWVLRELAARK